MRMIRNALKRMKMLIITKMMSILKTVEMWLKGNNGVTRKDMKIGQPIDGKVNGYKIEEIIDIEEGEATYEKELENISVECETLNAKTLRDCDKYEPAYKVVNVIIKIKNKIVPNTRYIIENQTVRDLFETAEAKNCIEEEKTGTIKMKPNCQLTIYDKKKNKISLIFVTAMEHYKDDEAKGKLWVNCCIQDKKVYAVTRRLIEAEGMKVAIGDEIILLSLRVQSNTYRQIKSVQNGQYEWHFFSNCKHELVFEEKTGSNNQVETMTIYKYDMEELEGDKNIKILTKKDNKDYRVTKASRLIDYRGKLLVFGYDMQNELVLSQSLKAIIGNGVMTKWFDRFTITIEKEFEYNVILVKYYNDVTKQSNREKTKLFNALIKKRKVVKIKDVVRLTEMRIVDADVVYYDQRDYLMVTVRQKIVMSRDIANPEINESYGYCSDVELNPLFVILAEDNEQIMIVNEIIKNGNKTGDSITNSAFRAETCSIYIEGRNEKVQTKEYIKEFIRQEYEMTRIKQKGKDRDDEQCSDKIENGKSEENKY